MARPVIGTEKTLANLTPEVLERHHASMVQPGSMIAAVVGDADRARVAARLARLPLGRSPRVPALPPLQWRGARLDVNREGTDQVHARLGFKGPAIGDRRLAALAVLSRTLGDGASSRLFQRLREDEGLTYDIWAGPVLRRLGGFLEIGWACAPAAFADAWRLVNEELGRLAGGDLGEDEVEVAKEGLLRGLEMDLESPGGICSHDVGEVLERGRRFDPETARREFEKLTVEDVCELAAEILRPEHMASAICGPEGVATRVA